VDGKLGVKEMDLHAIGGEESSTSTSTILANLRDASNSSSGQEDRIGWLWSDIIPRGRVRHLFHLIQVDRRYTSGCVVVPNLGAIIAAILTSYYAVVGVHLVAHDPPTERVGRGPRCFTEELWLCEDGASESGEDG
jgi:hypothetical protein